MKLLFSMAAAVLTVATVTTASATPPPLPKTLIGSFNYHNFICTEEGQGGQCTEPMEDETCTIYVYSDGSTACGDTYEPPE